MGDIAQNTPPLPQVGGDNLSTSLGEKPVNPQPKSISRKWLILITIVLAILILSILGIMYGKKESNIPVSEIDKTPMPSPIPSVESVDVSDVTSNWKTYTSKACYLTFLYPGELSVRSSIDDPVYGCLASLGLENTQSLIVTFSSVLNTQWSEIVDRNKDGEKIVIDSAEGLLTVPEFSSLFRGVYFHRGSIVYSLVVASAAEDEELEDIFNKIVSSIKFTGTEPDYEKVFIPIVNLKI